MVVTKTTMRDALVVEYIRLEVTRRFDAEDIASIVEVSYTEALLRDFYRTEHTGSNQHENFARWLAQLVKEHLDAKASDTLP